MKIGLDIRFLGADLYSDFVINLIQELVDHHPEHEYSLYSNGAHIDLRNIDAKIKHVDIQNCSFGEQFSFLRLLKREKNDLMIFFNHYKPIFYTGEYITFINSLKDVYYQNFNNILKKHIYLFLLEKNLRKSKKVFCFDTNTQNELIERFNIQEKSISMITAFFPDKKGFKTDGEIKIDVKAKYNLKYDYLVYSGGDGIQKNTEKLVRTFKKLKESERHIDLVFLGEEISKNINLRNLVIELKMQDHIHFMGVIKNSEKIQFYNASKGVVFPSLYETFPFRLHEPLLLSIPLIVSNLNNLKNILGDKVDYFSPISTNGMSSAIEDFLNKKLVDQDYSDILSKYKKQNTVEELLQIIE